MALATGSSVSQKGLWSSGKRTVWRAENGQGILGRIAAISDGMWMRGIFLLLLGAVIWALVLDYREMASEAARQTQIPDTEQVILPAYAPPQVPGDEAEPVSPNQRPAITSDPQQLRKPLSVNLAAGGVLEVSGSIDVGSASRFTSEVDRIGEYVKSVRLNSPGGSVQDALSISQKIRELELDTNVADGDLCASSCPLIFAGGTNRIAGKDAAIGVHQIYSPGQSGQSTDAQISGTQTMTARITRHLEEMGVDPALWLHALETPPRQLYYLRSEEMLEYQLATEITGD